MANNKPTPKNIPNKSVKSASEVEAEEIEVPEVVETEVEVAVEPEVEAEVAEVVAEENPVVIESKKVVGKPVPPTTYAVVGGGDKDHVFLSKAVYKSTIHKRSLTVHHLQRRLKEWGFMDAYLDKDGYFGDLTKKSIREFQLMKGYDNLGELDAYTFELIFEGDTNVVVHVNLSDG